jgi:hypothetical protein
VLSHFYLIQCLVIPYDAVLNYFLIGTMLSHFLIATVLSHTSLIQCLVIPHCCIAQLFSTAIVLSHSLGYNAGGRWLGWGRSACRRWLAVRLRARRTEPRRVGVRGPCDTKPRGKGVRGRARERVPGSVAG